MISHVLEIASDFLVTYPSLLDDLLDFENFKSRKNYNNTLVRIFTIILFILKMSIFFDSILLFDGERKNEMRLSCFRATTFDLSYDNPLSPSLRP